MLIVIFLFFWNDQPFSYVSMKFSGKNDPQLLPRLILVLLALVAVIFLQWLAVPLIFLFYIVISLLFKNRIA